MGKRLEFKIGDEVGDFGVIYKSDEPSRACPNGQKKRWCIFECPSCGVDFKCLLLSVRHGRCKSCGCTRFSGAAERATKHGLSKHPLYNIWNNIKHRTSNKKYSLYEHYGAKGVSMYKEWFDDFVAFYNWCILNGWKKDLEIDRKNTLGNYSPDNCRFITKMENMQNKLSSCRWIVNGVTYMSLSSAAKSVGVSAMTVRKRAMGNEFDNYIKEKVYD